MANRGPTGTPEAQGLRPVPYVPLGESGTVYMLYSNFTLSLIWHTVELTLGPEFFLFISLLKKNANNDSRNNRNPAVTENSSGP